MKKRTTTTATSWRIEGWHNLSKTALITSLSVIYVALCALCGFYLAALIVIT